MLNPGGLVDTCTFKLHIQHAGEILMVLDIIVLKLSSIVPTVVKQFYGQSKHSSWALLLVQFPMSLKLIRLFVYMAKIMPRRYDTNRRGNALLVPGILLMTRIQVIPDRSNGYRYRYDVVTT